jgi:hypothetical protein
MYRLDDPFNNSALTAHGKYSRPTSSMGLVTASKVAFVAAVYMRQVVVAVTTGIGFLHKYYSCFSLMDYLSIV